MNDSESSTPSLEEIEAAMIKMAAQTVDFAKTHFNIALDYSEESIKEMENMYEQIYEDIQQLQLEEKVILNMALTHGSYIGEVIRKYHGGHWEKDHEMLGENSWPIIFDDNKAVCPVAWCYKRMTNGKADDISYKYYVMVKKG